MNKNIDMFVIKLSIYKNKNAHTNHNEENDEKKESNNWRNQHQIGYLFLVVHALVPCATLFILYGRCICERNILRFHNFRCKQK